MKNSILKVLYFLTGLLSIIFLQQPSFFPGFLFKALIIPLLLIIFLINIHDFSNRLHRVFFAGLFFSWAGDVLLEFTAKNEMFFMLGLGCFLITHIMYIVVFLTTPGKNTITIKRIYLLIPVLVYGAFLVIYLYPHLGELRIPVIIYSMVILSMLSVVINSKDKLSQISFYRILGGAVLFVISDSAIAVNKFGQNFQYSDILIMSTYILAQYLILTGYLSQYKVSTASRV
jgi:uncharacterized membrane protein YhhN